MQIFNINERDKWDCIVKTFSNWDIYYTSAYAYSLKVHGDGDPKLLYFESEYGRMCLVVMQSDIARDERFVGLIEEGKYFDWETPYGYGGPLIEGEFSPVEQEKARREMIEYCNCNGVISLFVRFHPLLNNSTAFSNLFETRYLRDTIYVDTSFEENILSNMEKMCRRNVNKSRRYGVSVVRVPIDEYFPFLGIYEETMKLHEADSYYYFKEQYFKELIELDNNACFFYALYEGTPVSGALCLYNERFMHYHLGGTYTQFRQYAPFNLVLYEAACWASSQGITHFHLGGGMMPDDSLFLFKRQFNSNGRKPFCVGRIIFDKKRYNELLNLREKVDSDFDVNNSFMIQYRR